MTDDDRKHESYNVKLGGWDRVRVAIAIAPQDKPISIALTPAEWREILEIRNRALALIDAVERLPSVVVIERDRILGPIERVWMAFAIAAMVNWLFSDAALWLAMQVHS